MFDVITKKEYFEWCEEGIIPNLALLQKIKDTLPYAWFLFDIKSTQDGWIL